MKIIGRKVLVEADVSALAKKRLALWIKQLAEASWITVEAIKVSYPGISELGNSRIAFHFLQIDVRVDTLMNLDLGIICIEKVTEQEAGIG
jgi:mRNA-degrading endonuclease HigB of HigAB toxin-antitoxin module